MSILTPTSELASGHGAPVPVGAGLPDEGALARLASEFFAALPGAAQGFASLSHLPAAATASTPSSGAVPSAQALPSRALESATPPALGPNALPLAVSTTPPSAPVSLPSAPAALHAPGPVGAQAHAPAVVPDVRHPGPSAWGRLPWAGPGSASPYLPSVPSVPSAGPDLVPPGAGSHSLPAPSYYFLDSGAANKAPQGPELPRVPDDRVTAQSFGLPGQEALRSLLVQPQHEAPASPPQQSWYYFAEPQAAPRTAGERTPVAQATGHPPFDVNAVRRDFPVLQERVNGHPLVWLDNAATTHKPQAVIDRLAYFYAHENSNIHRAAHELAARATDAYESARQKVQHFLGASSPDEIVFVRGATEAINLVARTWGVANIGEGDEIVVSHLEHHANIVPWQMLASEKGARLRVIPVDDTGQILLEEARKLMNDRTKIVSVTQVSNALGTVTPVQELVALAHSVGAVALVDGAQAVSHLRVNVQALDADFYVFSGHKVFAPTGIGVVYGKKALLDQMPPYQGGGNMIADVTFERTVYQPPPNRFEAGTGNIADAVGLGAAIDYVQRLGLENIARYEHDLLEYTMHGLRQIPGVRLIGTAATRRAWRPSC